MPNNADNILFKTQQRYLKIFRMKTRGLAMGFVLNLRKIIVDDFENDQLKEFTLEFEGGDNHRQRSNYL